jgi:hypothetical protein
MKQFLEVNLRPDLSDACMPNAADHCSPKLSFWRNYDKKAKGNVVIKNLNGGQLKKRGGGEKRVTPRNYLPFTFQRRL